MGLLKRYGELRRGIFRDGDFAIRGGRKALLWLCAPIPISVDGPLIRRVPEGSIIPDWWGISHYELDRDTAVCYPIPLNIFVGGFWRSLVRWAKFPPWRVVERLEYIGIERIISEAVRKELRLHALREGDSRPTPRAFSKPL